MKQRKGSGSSFKRVVLLERGTAITANESWLKAAGTLFLAYSALMTLPWQPKGFAYDLDQSYPVALNQAFSEGIQFGQDFIYTYGPYGILQQVVAFPETYSSVLIGRLFISLVVGVGLWTIFVYCFKKHKISCVFLLPFLFFFPNSGISLDAFYAVVIALPLLVYFYVEEGEGPDLSAVMLLLVAGCSLTGLIKQTFLTVGVAVVLIITIDQVWRRRRPLIALVYLTCTFGFWLLAGQSPQNIGRYLANASQIVKGFSATMGTPGAPIDYIIYLLGALSFLALALAATYRYRRRLDLLPIAVLALSFFLAFKGAFVRHDAGHALQAATTSIPFACLYSALLWPEIKRLFLPLRRLNMSVPLWLISWVLLLINAQFLFVSHTPGTYADYYWEAMRNTGTALEGARLSLLGKVDLSSLYQDSLESIRVDNPLPELLPKLSGRTDLYPNELAIVLAYGLAYSSRPVIQSFSAYTGRLAEINAASLRTDNAPDTILFDVRAIDERLPSSEDGLSWPELLTRYELTDATGKYWVLKRRAMATRYSLVPLTTQTVALGDWVEVPMADSSAVWMKPDARPTLAGKLMTTLFKLPPLFLEAELSDGSFERRRVLADVLQAGQLLSPLVLDRGDFAYLATEEWPETLQHLRVRRMRLVAEGSGAIAYPHRYELSFSRFEFPSQDLSEVPGWKRIAALATLKQGETVNAEGNRLEAKNGPDGKLVLRAHADTRVVVSLSGKPEKLRLGYGILNEAWQEALAIAHNPAFLENQADSGPIADGVEFCVLALDADGKETALFSQWLDPHVDEGDRTEKTVEIDLSGISAKKLALDTRSGPAHNSRWDWAYWSRFELDGDELDQSASRVVRSGE